MIPGNQGTEGREQLVERPASPPLCAPGLATACTQAHSCRYAIGAGPGAGIVHRGLSLVVKEQPWRMQTSSHHSPACPYTWHKTPLGSTGRLLSWERRCWKGL